jgi:glyoxylate reductase
MKLGIVGFGRIGQAVARRARGFDMQVSYTQPRRQSEAIERELGATYVASLDELCESSDAISLTRPSHPRRGTCFRLNDWRECDQDRFS